MADENSGHLDRTSTWWACRQPFGTILCTVRTETRDLRRNSSKPAFQFYIINYVLILKKRGSVFFQLFKSGIDEFRPSVSFLADARLVPQPDMLTNPTLAKLNSKTSRKLRCNSLHSAVYSL